jgi:molybdate/tungstate transport system substrate-binding protein
MSLITRVAARLAATAALSALAASAAAQSTCAPGSAQVIIYHAGSLTAAFTQIEKLFTQQTGICVVDVAAGSVDAARRITAGREACDIYASADDKDIDVLLKPAGYADSNIAFAQGAMVLAYTTGSRNAATIAAPGATFDPPTSIPDAAPDWHAQLAQPGVVIGGSNPFLDPSGYRSDLIFQLAERQYQVPNLYDTLLGHYTLTRTTDALGTQFDYQFTYEHSALAAYTRGPATYRYLRLPEDIGLSNQGLNRRYADVSIVVPGLHAEGGAGVVRIPGSRVVWGLTVLRNAPNQANAIKFLQTLFGSQGVALQRVAGPEPISPPRVSYADWHDIPPVLRPYVRPEHHGH